MKIVMAIIKPPFLNQVYGVVIVFVYDAVVSLIILRIVDIFIGLRVGDEVEREGLDLALRDRSLTRYG